MKFYNVINFIELICINIAIGFLLIVIPLESYSYLCPDASIYKKIFYTWCLTVLTVNVLVRVDNYLLREWNT